jgi:hypothetical protein
MNAIAKKKTSNAYPPVGSTHFLGTRYRDALASQVDHVLKDYRGDWAQTNQVLEKAAEILAEKIEATGYPVLPRSLQIFAGEQAPVNEARVELVAERRIRTAVVIEQMATALSSEKVFAAACKSLAADIQTYGQATPMNPQEKSELIFRTDDWDIMRAQMIPALIALIDLVEYRANHLKLNVEEDIRPAISLRNVLSNREVMKMIIANDIPDYEDDEDFDLGVDSMDLIQALSITIHAERDGVWLRIPDVGDVLQYALRELCEEWLQAGVADYKNTAKPWLEESERARCAEIITARRRGGGHRRPITPLWFDFGQARGFDDFGNVLPKS